MNLVERMQEQRVAILRRWLQEVLECFPQPARAFIAGGEDRFSNPLGFTLSAGVEEIFSFVAGEKPLGEIAPALERLVKMRAIQQTRASEPLGFLFGLKRIVRDVCEVDTRADLGLEQWLALEERIDAVVRASLATYVRARETILELQVNEIRNQTYMLRRLAGDP
jgi:hypothetical protein